MNGVNYVYNEELNDLYSYYSLDIFRVIKSRRKRLAEHVARMGKKRGVYRVLMGKLVGKRPLGRPRRRWEDNIKMDLQEVGCGEMNGSSWLSKGTGGGTCECRNEPSAFIKYGEFLV